MLEVQVHVCCDRVIKDVCYQAGLNEKKVVLLVDDEMSKDSKCMDDVCSLMREGKMMYTCLRFTPI